MIEEFETKDGIVSFHNSDETARAMADRIINWWKENEYFIGECIQHDNFVINGPNLLANIIDENLKFEVKWKQ